MVINYTVLVVSGVTAISLLADVTLPFCAVLYVLIWILILQVQIQLKWYGLND